MKATMRCGVAVAAAAVWLAPAGARGVCVGDCPVLDARVAVNELVVGVGIALGGRALASCPSYDANGDGQVGVDELITAVNNALQGCAALPPASPTPPPASPTPSATSTPTSTPTEAIGPVVTFFGMTLADDSLVPPPAVEPPAIPVYERPFGFGFTLVVEAGRGSSGWEIGTNPFTHGAAPDLQVQVTRPLGDGSLAVCDAEPEAYGGVPAIDPPRLDDDSPFVVDAFNDLGCRFLDGRGQPGPRACAQSCVRFEDAEFACAGEGTELQFCASVPLTMAFPDGDTLVTARVRDVRGNLGPPAQLVVRVVP